MAKPNKSQDLEPQNKKTSVWDTGSSLYDSFELKSFENTLKSAIASRTLSMPHLSAPQPPPPRHHSSAPTEPNSNRKSKFSKPFQKLVRTLFGSRAHDRSRNGSHQNGFYVVLDKSSGAHSTIPEVHDTALQFSMVGRAVSERFGSGSVGMVSCA